MRARRKPRRCNWFSGAFSSRPREPGIFSSWCWYCCSSPRSTTACRLASCSHFCWPEWAAGHAVTLCKPRPAVDQSWQSGGGTRRRDSDFCHRTRQPLGRPFSIGVKRAGHGGGAPVYADVGEVRHAIVRLPCWPKTRFVQCGRLENLHRIPTRAVSMPGRTLISGCAAWYP